MKLLFNPFFIASNQFHYNVIWFEPIISAVKKVDSLRFDITYDGPQIVRPCTKNSAILKMPKKNAILKDGLWKESQVNHHQWLCQASMKPPFLTQLFYLLKLNFIVTELIWTFVKVGQKSIFMEFWNKHTDTIMCYLAGHRFNFYYYSNW